MPLTENQIVSFPALVFHKATSPNTGREVVFNLDIDPVNDWRIIFSIDTTLYSTVNGVRTLHVFTKEEYNSFKTNVYDSDMQAIEERFRVNESKIDINKNKLNKIVSDNQLSELGTGTSESDSTANNFYSRWKANKTYVQDKLDRITTSWSNFGKSSDGSSTNGTLEARLKYYIDYRINRCFDYSRYGTSGGVYEGSSYTFESNVKKWFERMRSHYTSLVNNAITTCKAYTDAQCLDHMPVGSIIPVFTKNTGRPTGFSSRYLLCDGSTFNGYELSLILPGFEKKFWMLRFPLAGLNFHTACTRWGFARNQYNAALRSVRQSNSSYANRSGGFNWHLNHETFARPQWLLWDTDYKTLINSATYATEYVKYYFQINKNFSPESRTGVNSVGTLPSDTLLTYGVFYGWGLPNRLRSYGDYYVWNDSYLNYFGIDAFVRHQGYNVGENYEKYLGVYSDIGGGSDYYSSFKYWSKQTNKRISIDTTLGQRQKVALIPRFMHSPYFSGRRGYYNENHDQTYVSSFYFETILTTNQVYSGFSSETEPENRSRDLKYSFDNSRYAKKEYDNFQDVVNPPIYQSSYLDYSDYSLYIGNNAWYRMGRWYFVEVLLIDPGARDFINDYNVLSYSSRQNIERDRNNNMRPLIISKSDKMLPNMNQDGIFLGGGSTSGDYVGWTIPNFNTGTFVSSDYVTSNRGGGSDDRFVSGYTVSKLSNDTSYGYKTNENGKLEPNHYKCRWLIKYR